MIVVGSAFTGGLIGAGVGSAFFGVGAYPGGALGTALGLQTSTFILGVLGLKSIAEYVVDGFPHIVGYYLSGIKTAWQGPREQGLNPFMSDDPYAQNSATQDIAKGHVEVVLLLLGAMVEYLTRGRGDARLLAQEMRASPRGQRLGQWMLKHEDALKTRPDLQRPGSSKSTLEECGERSETLAGNGEYVMTDKYAVALESGGVLPERENLILQAWGDVPVSYVQDEELLSACSFLDVKINKWEVNKQWSTQQESEPWIRMEILRGQALEDYFQHNGKTLRNAGQYKALLILELDEGGVEVDVFLFMRLISVFSESFKVYRFCDGVQEVDEKALASISARNTVMERLVGCW